MFACEMFGLKLLKTKENTKTTKVEQDTLKVFGCTPSYKDFLLLIAELKLLHGRFWTYFRMLFEQFETLFQNLASHVRRQSSHDLSGLTDRRYFCCL